MKLNKRIIITLFVIINILPSLTFGQCKKWPDAIEIITTDSDTITGYHKGMKFTHNIYTEKLVYKDEDCEKQKMSIRKIKFVLHNSDKYAVKYNKENGFLLLILKKDYGDIKYYNGKFLIEESYSHMPNGGYFPEREIEYHYVEMNNKLIEIRKRKKPFLNQMKNLLVSKKRFKTPYFSTVNFILLN